MFSLELPHRGDSNEYTQHVNINIKKKSTLNYPKYNNVCTYGIFPQGLKNEFDKAVANEPSVFEQLKFYCISVCVCISLKCKYLVAPICHSDKLSRF